MPSNTTPPSDSPITSLYLSDTFYTWHAKTNDLITKVNPIEVYSITAGVASGIEGITLSDDGYGNYIIGYALPATIPNDHTFSGDINFQAGISGHVVNTFNGDTGAVEGTATISGYANGGTPDFNVEGAIFSINGVTGTSFGACTIDGSDIPNTIGAFTGPAGYILVADGTNSITSPTILFSDQPTATQDALRVDPSNNRAAINSSTFAGAGGNSGARLYVKGDGEHGIKLGGNYTTANDIWMADTGVIAADNNLHIMCGFDGTNDYKISFSGSTSEGVYNNADNADVVVIYPSADYDFLQGATVGAIMEISSSTMAGNAIGILLDTNTHGGAHDISMQDRGSIFAEYGLVVYSAYGKHSQTDHGSSGDLFKVVCGTTFGGYSFDAFSVNDRGAIGVSWGNATTGISYGTTGACLMSRGRNESAFWERRYVISEVEATGTDYSEGMVWYQV